MSFPHKISIFFADNLHFHERNFKSLFTFIKKNNIKHSFNTTRRDWMALYGDYSGKRNELSDHLQDLWFCSDEELLSRCRAGINVFAVARAELLSFLLPRKNWRDAVIPSNSALILQKAAKEDRDTLLLNMAAAISWIDFWREELKRIPLHTYCCIFSGSSIYALALLEVLKTQQTTPLVFESFFTGNEYYCEKRYRGIANASDLALPTFYNAIHLPQDQEYDRERIKAINKMLMMANKNVQQPTVAGLLPFTNGEPVFSIMGQVINDFSIIESPLQNICSLTFYKDLIAKLMELTNFNVVFKAHPWERNKSNVRFPLTSLELQRFISEEIPESQRDRIYVTEDFNLHALFAESDYVGGLCSQALIEAAFHGFKPVVFGRAFFSAKGFTFDCETPEQFVESIWNGGAGTLTLAEFDHFERFLVKALEHHLVSVNPSGELKLRALLAPLPLISLQATSPAKAVELATPKPTPSAPTTTPAETSSIKAPAAPVKTPAPIAATAKADTMCAWQRKLAKFRHNPSRFFADSRWPIGRVFGRIFY